MILRLLKPLISSRLAQFPAVGIVGPRQSGKTTLAKEFGGIYFDMEQEADRLQLDLKWDELCQRDSLVILDEAQASPDVFPRLRAAIDARRSVKGRFLLLGSVAPSLMKQVGESLAGRLALVELPPLSLAELSGDYGDKLWKMGGFPDGGILDPTGGMYPVWQQSYLKQLTHQDLPAWGLPSKPQQTEHLLRLLAASHGAQLNTSELGKALGVSYHTIQSHLDFLEGAFLVRRLRPFFVSNFAKRLTKAPKLYWRDSGLLHHLLGLSTGADLFGQAWVGNSWEGWVIEQIIIARQSAGEMFNAWYFRTNDGLECDLVIDSDGQREIIEIKLTSKPATEDFKKLEKIAGLIGATRQVLISRVPDADVVEAGNRWSMNVAAYMAKFLSRSQPPVAAREALGLPSVSLLYQRLSESAGNLKDRGEITAENLMKRAAWLSGDLAKLGMPEFRILPTRWVEAIAGVHIPLVEYRFGFSGFSIEQAHDPLRPQKDSSHMEGSGLDREDLLYLSKVSEIGHTIIPDMWLADRRLAEDVRRPSQHLDTLNEVWWLSRWHGIDAGSVTREGLIRNDAENMKKSIPSTVDWKFTVLGSHVTINLSVKNRKSTMGSPLLNKGVYLFDKMEHEVFPESGSDEINVLAITAYHGNWITGGEQEKLIDAYFRSLKRPVIDAIILSVKYSPQGFSNDRLYFPKDRELDKRDLLLRAIFKPMDMEDQSPVPGPRAI